MALPADPTNLCTSHCIMFTAGQVPPHSLSAQMRWCPCAGDVRVLEGHAFIVEAAVSLGGRDLKPGLNVYRFANRIPLLFEVTHHRRPPPCCSAATSCIVRLHAACGGEGLEVHCAQGGSDVITKTAMKRINWALYKINQTQDRIGVFVSIVSTKIPFKGAGKEYIGMSLLH
jgi:DNA topoisomerase VI subunit B